MSEREKIAQYIASHFMGVDCEAKALEHADAILELHGLPMTDSEKRIEVVKLLHELRQEGEATGEVFLRGLRALKGLPDIVALRDAVRCVPPNPERSGYHWVRRFRGGPAIPLHWNPTWWHNADRGWGHWGQPDREDQWEYLGPCPSPDDGASTFTPEDHQS